MPEDIKPALLRDAYKELFAAATILEAPVITAKIVNEAIAKVTIVNVKLHKLERALRGVPEPKSGEEG